MTKYFTLQLALLSIKLAQASMTKRKPAQLGKHLALPFYGKYYTLPILELYCNIDFSAKYTKISK